jgi:hypothetical protein
MPKSKSQVLPKWSKTKKPTVAIWVGKFKHTDDLMTYARWKFTEEVGLPGGTSFDTKNMFRYRLGKKDGDLDRSLSDLEHVASYADAVKTRVKEMKARSFNAVIAVYGYTTEASLDRLSKRAQFVGFFDVDPKAERRSDGPRWDNADKEIGVWIGTFSDNKQMKAYAENDFYEELNLPPEYALSSGVVSSYASKSKGLLGALAYFLCSASYMPAVVDKLSPSDLKCNTAILVTRLKPDRDVSKLASKAKFLGFFPIKYGAGEYDIKKAKLPGETAVSILERCRDLLDLKKAPAGDELQGFLGRFRPKGEGLDELFDGIDGGAEIAKRIKAVMKADGTDAGLSLSVNKPVATTDDKAQALVKQFFGKVNQLARELDDDEVAELFPKSPKITLKKNVYKKFRENKRTNQAFEYLFTMTDEIAIAEGDTTAADMHDAIYTLVYDFGLCNYIKWPDYANAVKTKDPFKPYFDLWRRNIRWRLISKDEVEVFLPDGT